jgi:ribosomal protein S18 acetylase RimI-like enzyme
MAACGSAKGRASAAAAHLGRRDFANTGISSYISYLDSRTGWKRADVVKEFVNHFSGGMPSNVQCHCGKFSLPAAGPMIDIKAPNRRARPDDALAMAELVNMAGEGIPMYVWTRMAEAGRSPWEVGQERARRETGAFSYRNAIIREHDGEVVACLVGYPLEASAAPADYAEIPPMFVPMQQLEDMVPGTWYLNVLATYPGHRGKGHGHALLGIAEAIAADLGMRGMSIIVADSNVGARRLYERHGYRELARRPMVKEDWQNPGTHWVLLVKEL